mgnify:CR=1 FL=1
MLADQRRKLHLSVAKFVEENILNPGMFNTISILGERGWKDILNWFVNATLKYDTFSEEYTFIITVSDSTE